MDLVHPKVSEHLDALARHGDQVLEAMERRAAKEHFPIVGPVAGTFCYLLARAIGARRVFELGSGFGYSTLWFAKALAENGGGEVFHNVWDEGLSADARTYINDAGLSSYVQFHVGEAVAALRGQPGPFDIIFNDIDKDGYPEAFPVIKARLRKGGIMVVDNALWHGRIFDEGDTASSTEGVRELTRQVSADPDFTASLLPLRDGLIVAYKH